MIIGPTRIKQPIPYNQASDVYRHIFGSFVFYLSRYEDYNQRENEDGIDIN